MGIVGLAAGSGFVGCLAGDGHWPASLSAASPDWRARAGRLGLAVVSGRGGFGGLEHAVGHLVVGLGVAEAVVAGGAGLVGAVGAHLGAVALVVGGDIQRDQHGLQVAGRDDDRVPGCPGRAARVPVLAGTVPG